MANVFIKLPDLYYSILKRTPVNLNLKYGDIIIIAAKLQQVSSTGNPAAFDYRQYCYFQGIHYQVFLTASAYKTTRDKSINTFRNFIFYIRQQVVSVMQKYIPGSKESGLAQALLIGYKDNLDKELVQAYSNTGVVHVIAISGLHLGLIYAILILLTRKLQGSTTTQNYSIADSDSWYLDFCSYGRRICFRRKISSNVYMHCYRQSTCKKFICI